MGYKGTKHWKKAPFSHICPTTFPQNVAFLLWQHFIWCGNCPDILQVCQNLFFLSAYMWFGLIWLVSAAVDNASQISSLFSSQPRPDCIHPFYLFVSTSRMRRVFVESRQKPQQRTGCRPLLDILFPIYWVPWQFSLCPVDSVCVRPSLGLPLGPCALFHILYDVYTRVYSRLPSSSLGTILKSFFLLHSFLCLSWPPFIGRLVLPSSTCVVVLFFFHTKCTVVWQVMFS